MKIGDLNFGKTDAKNDILLKTISEKEFFKKSFLNTPNLKEDSFISGEVYFAYGLKGVGKTALLRFINLKAEENRDVTNFFLFKTQLSEDEKKNINGDVEIINENENVNTEIKDFEGVWRWFFLRKIYECSKEKRVFEENPEYRKFCMLMDSVSSEKGSLRSLFPRMKKGIIKLSKSPEVELDFEWHDKEKTQVKLSSLVHSVEEQLLKLTAYEKKLYIFCDELEISVGSKKSRTRDLRLIRDMICTVNRYNPLFRENNIPVYIIAAIRSEVLSAPECAGKEINKAYEDCGVLIDWSQSGSDIENEPLIDMILKKIEASLKETTEEARWETFFGKIIHTENSKKYILHNSWYKPRDIIRMLNLAKEKSPSKSIFDQESFDISRKMYSERCWSEVSEGISTNFGPDGVQFIVKFMTGFKKEFTKDELQNRINELDVEFGRPSIYSNKRTSFFLEIMYSCGMIGNKMSPERAGDRPKFRFVFRGDINFINSERYIVHSALRPYFSM